MASMATNSVKLLAVITVLLAVFAQHAVAKTHYYTFNIQNATFTKNCQTVTVATVNGQLPGPTIEIIEGDTIYVTVYNKQIYPVTMHWHGIRQNRTNYADGPVYVTQCPIQSGGSQIYEFTVENQRGTFFYHAHIEFLRATVHGALLVHPKNGLPSWYGQVEQVIPVILGEWFGINPNAYELDFLDVFLPNETATTTTPTVNGNAGPLYNCSTGTQTYKVQPKKYYLIKIINAALNNDYWFSVAGHKLKVLGADGNYLKPFWTKYVPIQPGQTQDVLLCTDQTPGKYYFGIDVGPVTAFGLPPPRIPALALFEYTNAPSTASPKIPSFPNNVTLVPLNQYAAQLQAYEESVQAYPETVDHDFLYAIGTAWVDCFPSEGCVQKIMGMIQNITFDNPKGNNILQAYLDGTNGVYTANFPDRMPSLNVNLTGTDPHYQVGTRGTRVRYLNFGDTVRIVFQNVYAAGVLDHPLHLHGHNFGVIGRGYGIYNPSTDPKNFNLKNPPIYNTYGIPNGGWLAIQWVANNPGVWLMHCHFERHTVWGMEMAFITRNGKSSYQRLPPPLHPLPKC